jgi:hypothetical protein
VNQDRAEATPYEAPSVIDLGRLEDITGATNKGTKNEGGSVKT